MAVRNFDGTDDEIRFGGAAIENLVGAFTAAVLVKLNAIGIYQSLMACHSSAGALRWEFGITSGNNLTLFVPNTGSANVTYDNTTAWYIAAVTKGDGAVTPTFHLAPISSGTFTRSAGVASLDLPAAGSGGFVAIGEADSTDDLNARVALAGLWNSALSNAQIDALATGLTTNAWISHAVTPVSVWQLNQSSTATAVEDLVGTVDQTVLNGTSVVTGDDPPSWTFYSASGDANVTAAVSASTAVGLMPSPGIAPGIPVSQATALTPTPTFGSVTQSRRNTTIVLTA